jgi:hypothetical protein
MGETVSLYDGITALSDRAIGSVNMMAVAYGNLVKENRAITAQNELLRAEVQTLYATLKALGEE